MPQSFVQNYISARNEAQDRAVKREADAHARSRAAVVEPMQDQAMQQKLTAGQQAIDSTDESMAATKEDRARAIDRDLVQRRGQFVGAIARQLEQNPNAKPSDIAKNAPPEVLKAIGLDNPEQMAHFAEVYDTNPQQLRAAADMYGQGRKMKGHTFVNKDGKDGMMVEFDDGTQHFLDGITENKQFRPGAEVDPELNDLRKQKLRADIAGVGARTTATEAKAGTGDNDGAYNSLKDSLNEFKAAVSGIDKGGGSVKKGQNIVQNAINAGLGTSPGKVIGNIVGDKNADNRQKIDTLVPVILSTVGKAVGKTASQLNTEKEYTRWASILGDPAASPTVRQDAADRLLAWADAQRGKGSGTAAKSGTVNLADFLNE